MNNDNPPYTKDGITSKNPGRIIKPTQALNTAHLDVQANHILHTLHEQQDRAGPPTAFGIHHPSQETDLKLLFSSRSWLEAG